MAQYDIYKNRHGTGLLLDVQTDLLSVMNSRVVVPLLERASSPLAARRLNPVFVVEETEYVMMTQMLAAVQIHFLGKAIGTLDTEFAQISDALDMLFKGF